MTNQPEGETVRVLVVDDEHLARQSLLHLLRLDPEVSLVGECGSGAEAVAAIDELAPDLVFLDIQMPEVDGFEVLRRLPADVDPEIIFVTAYDQFSLRAFEVHALDYLLKPVGRERFREALDHAKKRLAARHSAGRPADWRALSNAEKLSDQFLKRLAVRRTGRLRWVDVEDLEWIEAADYCARLHVSGASHLIRKPLKELEKELDPNRFVRVHRGAIVRIDRVEEIRTLGDGSSIAVLQSGAQVRMSRGKRRNLEKLL